MMIPDRIALAVGILLLSALGALIIVGGFAWLTRNMKDGGEK